MPVRHQAAARISLARVGGFRLSRAPVVGAVSVAVSFTAVLSPARVWVSPAAASTPRPASPSGYEAEAGQTFLVDAEPLNWNPHSAGRPEVGPTPPGVGVNEGAAASRVGEAIADTVGPDDRTLDQILSPVLPSVFQIGPRLEAHLNTAFVESAVQTGTSPQTIVYRINPRAVWSDGTPITYRDFVYNWQAQSGQRTFSDVGGVPFNPLSTDGYRQIASVRESGGDRDLVKVVFKTPDPDWRSLFSLMLPAHVAADVGFNTGFADPVNDLSAGPFEVQSYTPGVSVTLVRNQRYWGTPANLAQISYRFVAGSSAMLATLAAGDADAAAPPPAVGLEKELTKAVSSHPSRSLALSGFAVDEVAGPTWEHLDFNQAKPLLADRAVRRAIMMAVNRKELIAATVGKGDPSVKPLGSLVFVPGQAGYHNDAGVYGTGNILGARTALVQDGFTYSGERLLQDGHPVTLGITAPAGDPMLAAEEHVLASQLANIGIGLAVHNSSNVPASLAAGQFDLALVSSQSSPFLSTAADRYQTNNGTGTGAKNVDHYSSRTTDRLIAQAEATAKPATRIRLFERLDGQLWADAVSLPLYQAPQFLVFDRKYLNMVDSPAPSGLAWDITKWGLPASA